MAYTPPAYNGVDFNVGASYTAPSYNAVDFAIGSGGGTQSASHVSSGGGIAGGIAAVVLAVVLASSGGAVAGGTTTTATSGTQSVSHVSTGGAVAGGSSPNIFTTSHVSAGGGVSGGTTVCSYAYKPSHVSSGGAVAGGTSPNLLGKYHTSAGGAVAGGTTVAYGSVGVAYSSTGGAVAGGTTERLVGIHLESSGGAVAGGNTSTSRTELATHRVHTTSGGAVAGGTAGGNRTSSHVSTGGAIAGGDTNCQPDPWVAQPTDVKYLPAISSTYIKSTTSSSVTGYTSPLPAGDWANTVVSDWNQQEYNAWRTATTSYNGSKLNFDYSTGFVATKIAIFNFRDWDDGNGQVTSTEFGFNSFKVYGSNSSTDFNNTTLNSVPASGTLILDTTSLQQEDSLGPYQQEFTLTNTTSYRYYIVMFSGTKGGNQGGICKLALYETIPVRRGDIAATMPSLSCTMRTPLYAYPLPALSATYAKSTTSYGGAYGDAFRAMDMSLAHDGGSSYQCWESNTNSYEGAKVNLDYVTGFALKELQFWNYHDAGSDTNRGVANVRVYGSNDVADFNNVTLNSVPASGTLLLNTAVAAHSGGNISTPPQVFQVVNSTAYRYYILFFTGNKGSLYYGGFRQARLLGPSPPSSGSISATLPALTASIDAEQQGHVRVLKPDFTESDVYPGGYPENDPHRPFLALSQSTSLIGDSDFNGYRAYQEWSSPTWLIAWDAGVRYKPYNLDIENYHDSGGETDQGVNDFALYGTNNPGDFDNAVYPDIPPNGTLIKSGTVPAHAATNTPDRHRVTITNNTQSFRYFFFFSNSNHGDTLYGGVRRVTLWGDVDVRLAGDLIFSMPQLSVQLTAPVPENVCRISATIRRLTFVTSGAPATIEATMKPMTAFMVVNNEEGPPVGNLDITLPALTASNPEPAWCELSATIPSLNAIMRRAPNIALSLPGMEASMSARCSIPAHLAASIPMLNVRMMRGAAVDMDLPSLQASISAKQTHRVEISAALPPLSAVLSATGQSQPVDNDVVISASMPRLSVRLSAVAGRAAHLAASMPRLGFASRGLSGKVADIALTLPSWRVRMTGDFRKNDVNVSLPSLSAEIKTQHTCAIVVLEHNRETVQW